MSSSTHVLAGFGVVRIDIVGETTRAVCVAWDNVGHAHMLKLPVEDAPRLIASEEAWVAYVAGEFTATEGILKGYFDFDGALSRLYPYAEGFDLLAEVGRNLEENW